VVLWAMGIGSSRNAAERAGLHVGPHPISLTILSSALAGISSHASPASPARPGQDGRADH
jgi:ribose/xylose/arabinose/galactoside ABC-type transport system permease subunit